MKNKSNILFWGLLAGTMLFAGCGPNKAAEAVNESEEIEKEGKSSESSESEEQEGTKEKESEEAEESKEEAVKVGILLPQEGTSDEEFLKQKFQEAGYAPEILTAQGDSEKQKEQIQNLVEEEVAALVVDPVDAYALSDAFDSAQEKSIPVFSYDSLIRDTELVKYYTTFDAREAGHLVGETIADRRELNKAREEKLSYTIEFLMGAPEDVDELFFYNGILEVLQEYLDDGTLVCKSGKTSFDDTSVMRGSETTAKNQFRNILNEFYAEGAPDIICTAADSYTYGVTELLEEKGITKENGNLPLITGFGSEAEAVKHVAEETLGFTLFLDRSELAEVCVKMVDGSLTGEKAKVDNYSQYDNGKKIVGTYTCEAKLIDKDNYQLLIDNGMYSEEDIMPQLPTPTATMTPEPKEEATEEKTKEEIKEEAKEPEKSSAEEKTEVKSTKL